MSADPALLLTTAAVAAQLGVTPARVRQLAAATGLGERYGRDWLFSSADLEALRRRKTARGPVPKEAR